MKSDFKVCKPDFQQFDEHRHFAMIRCGWHSNSIVLVTIYGGTQGKRHFSSDWTLDGNRELIVGEDGIFTRRPI